MLHEEILVVTFNNYKSRRGTIQIEMFVKEARFQFEPHSSRLFEFFREGQENEDRWRESAKKRAEEFSSPTKDILKELSDIKGLYAIWAERAPFNTFKAFIDPDKRRIISKDIVKILKKYFVKDGAGLTITERDWDDPYPRK